ncbi:hypothetical protein IMZ48_26420 [Candidatus Bathyarchaeota archaeon]|nr:hypothetical protein [Candidatus Bathyarchaeota archaeon]
MYGLYFSGAKLETCLPQDWGSVLVRIVLFTSGASGKEKILSSTPRLVVVGAFFATGLENYPGEELASRQPSHNAYSINS